MKGAVAADAPRTPPDTFSDEAGQVVVVSPNWIGSARQT